MAAKRKASVLLHKETLPTPGTDPALAETNPEEAYAGLMKDADKLKLMLLAWNYQNSNAIRNGAEAPDLGVVGGLWAQYQNALALNAKQPSVSPINRTEQPSPIENQDETNSSGQKDEDDGSEDDSDDKLDQNAHDPERLKAFNMFVRLFVDENLDRMIPISKQPKEKIQAIIDSCARQFPEFCERSRKRIRTYLKSCRRNKKAREGWDNASRPTPAHLTSVQAEQILAMACENESLNAKRMRIGLDPISQSLPLTSNSTVTTDVVAPSITYPGFRATPSTTAVSTSELDAAQPSTTTQTVSSARSSPISLTTNLPAPADSKPNTPAVNGTVTSQIASPLYRPTEFTSPTSTSSPYTSSTRPTAAYPVFFPASNNVNATPTDLSMKQHTPTTTQPCNQQLPTLPVNTGAPVPASGRPPLLSHKLNPNEMSAVRQLITGYRESAAFLLRSADELEQLLLQQQ